MMDYEVVSKINIKKDNFRKVGAFLYCDEQDALYHESPGWPFPVQLMISKKLTKCQVTPFFLKLPFILKGWINLDILLREIDLMRLVEQGKILMHASCVDHSLITGFPNSGKTYQTYRRVATGGKLISEEYTVIQKQHDTGSWVATPYKPIMRTCFSRRTIEDCHIKTTTWDNIKLVFAETRAALMPFMFEGAIWKEIPVSGYHREIKKIEYGSTGHEVKNWKAFAILCENEFPFMANEFLQAYAIAAGLDLIEIQNNQRNLIREFIGAVYPDSEQQ